MYLNYIFLITSILGFTTIFLIGNRYKSNPNVNLFLLILLYINSFRFLVYGIPDFQYLDYIKHFLDIVSLFTTWPFMYLYMKKLYNSNPTSKLKCWKCFILPFILMLFFLTRRFVNYPFTAFLLKYSFLIVAVYCLTFFVLRINILYKHRLSKKSNKFFHNQEVIKNKWSTFILIIFSIQTFRLLFFFLFFRNLNWMISNNYIIVLGLSIWIFMFLRVISSPDFIYGYNQLQVKINSDKINYVKLNDVWILENKISPDNIQDRILRDKIQEDIHNYIVNIENIALGTDLFLQNYLLIDKLAVEMKVPKSHLKYIFKYHSKISFSEFKKTIQIKNAIEFIDKGYLKTNTLDSLAIKTGFSSYSPFFKSFKAITKLSPQDYFKDQKDFI